MSGEQISQRADWRRNRQRLLTAAAEMVARDGAAASLEAIARRADLGSATLHRHFSSRDALLSELFREGVEHIADRGRELNETAAGDGLAVWLDILARYTASTRGLAVSLGPGTVGNDCHGVLAEVAVDLASTAVKGGLLRPDVTPGDLLALVNGIAIQAEDDPDLASRLLRIALGGVRPSP